MHQWVSYIENRLFIFLFINFLIPSLKYISYSLLNSELKWNEKMKYSVHFIVLLLKSVYYSKLLASNFKYISFIMAYWCPDIVKGVSQQPLCRRKIGKLPCQRSRDSPSPIFWFIDDFFRGNFGILGDFSGLIIIEKWI